ncbi:MAG: hypothetical protein IT441_08550, partial [Phycisphaeraceae bacterium]|nr:hypothetical protein [Phycisphaeraceae bacterium]
MRSTMQRWAVGVLALGMGLGVGTARGTVILSTEWIGTPGQSGDWFDPANWQGGGVPRPGTYATISNGGEAVISGGEAKAGRVELLGETAGQWNLSLTGGSLTIDGQFSGIFMGQQAGLRVSGGILRADRILAGVRGDANNRVRIEQDGGVIELSGGLLVNGEPTPDFVTIFPATNQSTELTVAEPLLPTPRGRYDLTGGRVSTQWSTIGSTGYAVMKQTGGTHEVAGSLTIGGGMLPMFTWDRPKELPGKPVGGILLPPTYYTQGVSPSVVEGAPVLIGPIDATPLNTSRGAYQIEGGLLKTGRIEVKNSGSLDQSG